MPNTRWSALLLLLLACAASRAAAQGDTLFDALLLERLGLLENTHTGARATAMPGASAWSEDLQSLTLNPAGLAAIGRIETQIGFRRQSNRQTLTYFGTQREFDPASTGLDALGVAYPVPTYRGSFVLAAGVFRSLDSVMEMIWQGTNAYDGDEELYTLRLDGSTLSWVAGAAVAVGQQTDVGASIEYLRGELTLLSRFDYRPQDPGNVVYRSLAEDGYGLAGLRAHLGLRSRPWLGGSIGLRLSTPLLLNSDGENRWRDIDIEDGVAELFDEGVFLSEEELRLPYQFAAGIAHALGAFQVAGEIEYSDWSQTTVGGSRLRDLNLREALQGTVNFGLGAEFAPARLPLRLYAGYGRRGEPLRLIESGDFVDGGEGGGQVALLKTVEVLSSRTSLSFGLGLLLSDTLLVEAAYRRESGERRTAPSGGIVDLVQETARQRVVLTFSYRQ